MTIIIYFTNYNIQPICYIYIICTSCSSRPSGWVRVRVTRENCIAWACVSVSVFRWVFFFFFLISSSYTFGKFLRVVVLEACWPHKEPRGVHSAIRRDRDDPRATHRSTGLSLVACTWLDDSWTRTARFSARDVETFDGTAYDSARPCTSISTVIKIVRTLECHWNIHLIDKKKWDWLYTHSVAGMRIVSEPWLQPWNLGHGVDKGPVSFSSLVHHARGTTCRGSSGRQVMRHVHNAVTEHWAGN